VFSVLLCFINPILGNRYGPGVIPFQGTWGARIHTLHLNYVAGYTGPLLFLFKWTHNYYVVCCFVLLNQYWGIVMYGHGASS